MRGVMAPADVEAGCEILSLILTFFLDSAQELLDAGPDRHKIEKITALVQSLHSELNSTSSALAQSLFSDRNVREADQQFRAQMDIQSDLLENLENKLVLLSQSPPPADKIDAVLTLEGKAADGLAGLRSRVQTLRSRAQCDIRVLESLGPGGGGARGLDPESSATYQRDCAEFQAFLDQSEKEEQRLWNTMAETTSQLRSLAKTRCSRVKDRILAIMNHLRQVSEYEATIQAARVHRESLLRLTDQTESSSHVFDLIQEVVRSTTESLIGATTAGREAHGEGVLESHLDLFNVYRQWAASRTEYVSKKRALLQRLDHKLGDAKEDLRVAMDTLDTDADLHQKTVQDYQEKKHQVLEDIEKIETDLAAIGARMAPVQEFLQAHSAEAAAGHGPSSQPHGYGQSRPPQPSYTPRQPPPRRSYAPPEGPSSSSAADGPSHQPSSFSAASSSSSSPPRVSRYGNPIGEAAALLDSQPPHSSYHHRPPPSHHTPSAPRSSHARVQQPGSEALPAVFEKLTDHHSYTGVHRFRFSESGRGRGIRGTDHNTGKGRGHVGQGHSLGGSRNVQSLAEVLRT
eukprot:NODE_633_length_1899_cov_6.668649_g508_i0.p1 GENE.NODE_633_length_1899_cov_6.668649_g508_i0~~NODE_633_length_1899_cov_6.668649_g508_i0.p1  ORF type:complete len:590 (-),score=116.62 NODE_633_length_1899_cov_6.668649_g508_i0:130-1848(-)